MSSSPPEARAVAAEDFAALAEIVREVESSLGLRVATAERDLRDCAAPMELATDSLVLERGDRPIAFAWVFSRDGVAWAQGIVRPSERGVGLGATLAGFCESRAAARGARTIRADALAPDARAAELFASRGYREARRFYELAIELGAAPKPTWPAGVEPKSFEREDARVFHATIDEAFADDPGFVSTPFDEWYRLRVDGTDTSLYFLARAGDAVAGVIRCEVERRGIGWVGALGVLPEWRGRGVGRALLLHAFAAFHERGQPRVGLGVDTRNPTGALQLYESVGMRVEAEDAVYELTLA